MIAQSLIIIGTEMGWEELEILKAAKARGMSRHCFKAATIEIRLTPTGTKLYRHKKDITSLFQKSRLLFRRSRGAQEKMITLALLAEHWGLSFTDGVTSIMSNLNKSIFLPSVSTRWIRPIPTLFCNRGEMGDLSSLTFPLLSKPVHGRHGEDVTIFDRPADFKRFLKTNLKSLMIQPFLPIEKEYRVFVVGKKALGVVQKIPRKGSRIANYARGATFLPSKLPSAMIREAVKLCRDQQIDIGGVDLAQVGTHFYLLEVNRCPEFKAFSLATGIVVADQILNFILNK